MPSMHVGISFHLATIADQVEERRQPLPESMRSAPFDEPGAPAGGLGAGCGTRTDRRRTCGIAGTGSDSG